MFYIGLAIYISIIETMLLISSCHAATPEEQYNIATNCYENLKNSPERQKYRHNWLNCIEKFSAVYSGNPNHYLASSGMYRASELYLDLYKISAIEKDKIEAIDLLNRIIKRYPSSTDRDMAEKLLSSLKPKSTSINKEISAKNADSKKNIDNDKSSSSADFTISSDGNAYITDLRYWTTPDYTRVVINISDERRYIYQFLDENPSTKQPQRLYLDIKKSLLGKNLPSHTRINDDLLLQARAGQYSDETVRVVVDIKSFESYKVFSMRDPFRIIVDVWGDKSEKNSESEVGKTASNKIKVEEPESGPTKISSKSSTKESELMVSSEPHFESDVDLSLKRSSKKSTKISTLTPTAIEEPSEEESISSSEGELSSKVSTKTATKLSTPHTSQVTTSSSTQSSKKEREPEESTEIASEINSKESSHLPVKRSLKSSTMVLSDATRKMLRDSLGKESQKTPASRIATKGTTRVVQIAPGSNVDKIKASSIAKQLALGVRTIVIDPGHGGRDPGAIGYSKGVYEKDVVLAISKKLAKKIENRLNCNVIMTRSSDTFLTLEERTAIANTKNADLFISLHCNASNDQNLIGIETYYLNLATDERAINVAARENATSKKNISDLESILNDLMKNAKINESSRLSSVVQKSLYNGMKNKYSKVKNLGVKQAPFYVLLGASMPSILIETSFISNPEECKRLTDSAYQNALCDAITDGIAKYIKETNPQSL